MKTVKVRVAVAVGAEGLWGAAGWRPYLEHESLAVAEARMKEQAWESADSSAPTPECYYWLTAELPIPDTPEIEADVEEAS